MSKFQIYRDTQGQYRWRFVAANGQKICWSEAYTTKANALHSIQIIKSLAATAPIFE